MPDPPDYASERQRLIEHLQRSLAEGWLGTDEVSERLDPPELRLLREKPSPDDSWSEETQRRLVALEELAESRRLRATKSSSAAAARGGKSESGQAERLHVLLIGFEPAERDRLVRLLDSSRNPEIRLRSAESVEQAPILLARERFDAALLDLTAAASSRGVLLSRAEVTSAGVPVVAIVARDSDPQIAQLGTRDWLVMSEIDELGLIDTLTRTVEHHRLSEALESSRRREHFYATRDTMTGLPNRFSFREQLEQALYYAERHDQQLAVFSASIDEFDHKSADLGHEVADSLLIALAGRMSRAVRKSDLVARVGGDEFLLMLHGREIGFAPERSAERILDCLSGSFMVDGQEQTLSVSIGIANFPREGADPETLIRNAVAARIHASAEGGAGYRFYGHSADAVEMRRRRVEQRLRGVFERGDLEIRFQPRVDVRDGRIVGAQALLRWNDAELGPVSPAEFIPIAEHAGLVSRIGAWTLQEACLAQRRWDSAGFGDVRVSVNVSQQQQCSISLRDAVVDAVLGAGLAPGRLEIELLESALSENQGAGHQLLQDLAEIGVELSLDDFGTGLPSLSVLRELPVSTLKIDPSFVHDITPEAPASPSVDALVSLAQSLDLNVVAEGVETESQRDALQACGCNQMQGLLFSRPLDADEFLQLLEQRRDHSEEPPTR